MILLSTAYFHGFVDQQTVVAGVEASKSILEGFFFTSEVEDSGKAYWGYGLNGTPSRNVIGFLENDKLWYLRRKIK